MYICVHNAIGLLGLDRNGFSDPYCIIYNNGKKVRTQPEHAALLVEGRVSLQMFFTPQPLRAVRVLFSPMVSGWAGGWATGKSLSGLYLRNRKV